MKILTKKAPVSGVENALFAQLVSSKELPGSDKKNKKHSGFKKGSQLAVWDEALNGTLQQMLANAKFKGTTGQTLVLNAPLKSGSNTVLLIGWEDKKEGAFESVARYRQLGSIVAETARRRGFTAAVLQGTPTDLLQDKNARALIEGAVLSGYSFEQYKSKKDESKTELETMVIESAKQLSPAIVEEALLASRATMFARDLVNTPPRDCTPSFLADHCKRIAKSQRIAIDVYDMRALKKMGAGALLAVAQGSEEPAYLIRMVYKPKKKSKRTVSLVGKGVTFDSGGLSIKTGTGMETMKSDMSGAAAVMGVMSIISELEPDLEVRAYIPTTENMISGCATRPGDIVTAMSGKTIEILNTDAEGRLILADAITLAEKDKSDEIIDLATLTGACMVALGTEYAGVFSNDDTLASRLQEAGDAAGEHLWRMPLVKEYKDWIKSPVADIKNLGKPFGGAITGALFLEEFVVKARWAHIDIAGPAFTDSDKGHIRRGGVGFGVRTLINYLQKR